MRFCALLLLAALVVGAPPRSARAELCTIDAVPAATLLLPYFELRIKDLKSSKPKGPSTVIFLRNTQAVAALARVILWTDLSIPTYAFDVLLSGFSQREIPLRDIFRGAVPGGTARPCSEGNTRLGPTQLSQDEIERLITAHSGQPVEAFGELCAATPSDGFVRGYVTIDNIFGCPGPLGTDDALFPGDPGYFLNDGVGMALNFNILSGDVIWEDARKWAASFPLVSIEAADNAFTNGDYTFYGRYTGFDGSDDREPLGTTWSARFAAEPKGAKRATRLMVWRDAGVEQKPFTCNALQNGWYPLGVTQVVAFDEQGDAEELDVTFPAEANLVEVDGDDLPVDPLRGWLFLNLNLNEKGLQSVVIAEQSQGSPKARGAGMATQLTHACGTEPPMGVTPIPGP